MPNEDYLSQSALRNEYNVVASNWRFLVGLRFVMLAFSATLLSALMGFYQFAVMHPGNVGDSTATAIAVFGVAATMALILLEERTRDLFLSSIKRGIEIESLLKISPAHFRKLHDTPNRFCWYFSPTNNFCLISHTVMIRYFYGVVILAWLYLAWSAS